MMDELTISHGELIHHKMQAALRENNFDKRELMYLGIKDGAYMYLVGGVHEVASYEIANFEKTENNE